VEEHVLLGDDRQSLQTTQPIGAAGSVRVLLNNDDRLFLPQSGLFAPARLYSTASGPFDLVAGEDDLTISTPAGEQDFSFGVSNTARLTTSQVIQSLLQSGLTVALAENINGHLNLSDISTVGQDSFVRVRGRAASALGFGNPYDDARQRGARGRMLFPGWVLQGTHTMLTGDATARFPRFVTRVQSNPMFKVTYTTTGRSCRRCGGSFIENDFRFDNTGQGLTIENENLLYQAALKILLTNRGSNPYFDDYGSTIQSRIGSKALSGVAAAISEDVRRTLANMQTGQQDQAQYQQVTAKERLYAILRVQTVPHVQDQTTFLVDVVVQNASAEPVSLSIVFSVPEVVALLGSNGLFLGTEAAGLKQEQQKRLFAGGRTLLPVDGG
jgi:phage baseplate assembly protein W